MKRSIPFLLVLAACTEPAVEAPPPSEPAPPEEKPAPAEAPKARAIEGPTLLLSLAQFKTVAGKTQPGAARLRIFHRDGKTFSESVLEDPESKVFHKAACVNEPGLEGVLTIGATDAHLKLWTFSDGAWTAQTLWTGKFGGKFDRLRDFELGDLDGDGASEIAIATHDQGVVTVMDHTEDGWKPIELYQKADTFVHEIELGDIDGDKKLEIYATPSAPNRVGKAQSGDIVGFRYNKKRKKWATETVVELVDRHAKEILVDDLDGDGKDELYAAVEAHGKPVQVQRFDKRKKKWLEKPVAEFAKGAQARVLLMTDLTGRGGRDIVVTTMSDGIWRIVPEKKGFDTVQIDPDSGGFEHAAHATDLDADGTPELYVTSDNDDELRSYVWNGRGFDKTTIGTLDSKDLVWNIVSCN